MAGTSNNFSNYISYVEEHSRVARIGYFDFEASTIQPLSYASGTPVRNLYQVIEASQANVSIVAANEDRLPASSVRILPPISGRDVLAVGKNYAEHAKEFNQSGYDRSDTVDQPTHPVIFTKRETSIIASGDPIVLAPEFTQTLDYEGEIGVIVGKSGSHIPEQSAMDYVWGYTIINDVTAREKQRDHKQFFLGKSGDTYCPMGPVAVPASHISGPLDITTTVNGEVRQRGNTGELIFSIARLISSISQGQTLQPGDVLATGTPAGVGFGRSPPTFLQPGDQVEVSVPQLGTLTNKVVARSTAATSNGSMGEEERQLQNKIPSSPMTNNDKSLHGTLLSSIGGGKPLYYKRLGVPDGPPVVFVHGLGGTCEFYSPLISALSLDASHSLHLFDLEGHGLSPSSALSSLSIDSFATDVKGVCDHAGVASSSSHQPVTLIAHSMGCLVALAFVLQNPGLVQRLILLGPPPNPFPDAASKGCIARAATVRRGGMPAVTDAVVSAGTSTASKETNPVAIAAVRQSLLGQDPEGYAKACTALAGASADRLPAEKVDCPTLIVTGEEDKVGAPAACSQLAAAIPRCDEPIILPNVGHWHVFEDVKGVSDAVRKFLS